MLAKNVETFFLPPSSFFLKSKGLSDDKLNKLFSALFSALELNN